MKRWIGALGRSWRHDRDRWLLGAAALALVATLWRPTLPMERLLFDQVVIFDITQSMDVKDEFVADQPVSRLEFAKRRLREALVRLPCGSRVGWGVFTEYRSYLLLTPVEVCANLSELRATLDHIDNRMAWTGNSEIAKGLYSAIGVAKQMPGGASLVFVTDGHESPPVNPRHRPPFNGKAGEVQGLILGVGGLRLLPIPRSDPEGRPIGVWGPDDVMQTDPRSQGRGGSVGHELLAEDADGPIPVLPGATPGSEHLSSLREAYLRLLAGETGLAYQHLQSEQELMAALTARSLARPVPATLDLRGGFAALALLSILARYGRASVRAWHGKQFRSRVRTVFSRRVQSPR